MQALTKHGYYQTDLIKIGETQHDICVSRVSNKSKGVHHTVFEYGVLREEYREVLQAISWIMVNDDVDHGLGSRGT